MRDDKRLIKEAIDETFAYLDERPSLEARIMNSIDAQERPRRRVRTSLILAFAILLALSVFTVLTGGGPGLFRRRRGKKRV